MRHDPAASDGGVLPSRRSGRPASPILPKEMAWASTMPGRELGKCRDAASHCRNRNRSDASLRGFGLRLDCRRNSSERHVRGEGQLNFLKGPLKVWASILDTFKPWPALCRILLGYSYGDVPRACGQMFGAGQMRPTRSAPRRGQGAGADRMARPGDAKIATTCRRRLTQRAARSPAHSRSRDGETARSRTARSSR
jgi:hypothetical protein